MLGFDKLRRSSAVLVTAANADLGHQWSKTCPPASASRAFQLAMLLPAQKLKEASSFLAPVEQSIISARFVCGVIPSFNLVEGTTKDPLVGHPHEDVRNLPRSLMCVPLVLVESGISQAPSLQLSIISAWGVQMKHVVNRARLALGSGRRPLPSGNLLPSVPSLQVSSVPSVVSSQREAAPGFNPPELSALRCPEAHRSEGYASLLGSIRVVFLAPMSLVWACHDSFLL